MIGTGKIGGKACGMLLARKIAETELKDYRAYAEPHDSFYIGSDVFYTYIVSNGDWRLRIRQRSEEGYFEASGELRERLLTGKFPGKIREQFESVLEYFGQSESDDCGTCDICRERKQSRNSDLKTRICDYINSTTAGYSLEDFLAHFAGAYSSDEYIAELRRLIDAGEVPPPSY